MKKYKVYIQTYNEITLDADSPDDARMEVCNNLSDYLIDMNLLNAVVGDAEEIK